MSTNNEEKSKVVVYPNGEILNIVAVREMVCGFWNLSECEKRSFLRTVDKYPTSDLITLKNKSNEHK